MPLRPHSISELAQFAKDDSPAATKGIKDWLRVADALRKQGQQANQDGDYQGAFLFLARSATYILEKIPHHPNYHELNPTQMSNLKNNGHDILHSLEQLKPRLADRYEQWLAQDPRNIEIPSQLQSGYGTSIAPVVVSRAKRQDSRDRPALARAAVSSESLPNNIRPTVSINDLQRDMDGMRIAASPEARRPRSDTAARRMQEEAERRQWQEQADVARRKNEEAARVEEAARRQWEMEQEMDRRARDEQRRRTEYEQSQRIKDAAMDAARQAAGYNPQSSRYRESAIASAASPPTSARSQTHFDALPHHPLQGPALMRSESQEQATSPIWATNHTPTATRSQRSLYKQPSPLDTSFPPNIHIQYPQLMSAHQRAQGYQPSVMLPSPQASRGGSSSLYNITLPQQAQAIQYPPPRTTSMIQPQYSPAPPPASAHSQSINSGIDYPSYDTVRAPRSQQPAVSNTHKRQSSIQEVPKHPLGLRSIDMPAELLDQFLGVARLNTLRKIETCGLLLGNPRGAGFSISTLLIPEQRGTPDTCIMESEELVVEFSTGRDMLTLGWIHTHPTQSCFMSSLDLHTHAAYQSTLKEAIAIVCAPTSDPKFGIFRLTDPPGLDTVMTCRAKETFHPHPDHLAIYTDCDGSHVRLVSGMHLEIVDLRRGQDFSSSEGTRDV